MDNNFVFNHREGTWIFYMIIKLWLLMITFAPYIQCTSLYNNTTHFLSTSWACYISIFKDLFYGTGWIWIGCFTCFFIVALSKAAISAFTPGKHFTSLIYSQIMRVTSLDINDLFFNIWISYEIFYLFRFITITTCSIRFSESKLAVTAISHSENSTLSIAKYSMVCTPRDRLSRIFHQ